MVKKINQKTSGISLAGFQPRASSVTPPSATAVAKAESAPTSREPSKSFTGAGIFMSAITGKDELAKDLADVQAKLAAANKDAERFIGADVVRALSPSCIKASRWANRSEASLRSKDFEKLKLEIENAGGNVQPIKVRPLSGALGEFEIVFGHRRHRACLELGLPVRALIEEMGDADLFAQMDRENRQRADLRPFEQGVMYAKALDEGLFTSMRKMAEALGVDVGNASKAVALARLPTAVLGAFQSPLDLQQAWATPLSAALQKNPDAVLAKAKILAAKSPKLASQKVFSDLLEQGVVSNNTPSSELVTVTGVGDKSGKVRFNQKKKRFEIELSGLDSNRMDAVARAIKALLV